MQRSHINLYCSLIGNIVWNVQIELTNCNKQFPPLVGTEGESSGTGPGSAQ